MATSVALQMFKTLMEKSTSMSEFENSIVYIHKAREIVYNYLVMSIQQTNMGEHITVALEDVFVVWFSKTLKNWKALVGTTLNGDYYEITYNGDKKETYLDVYQKTNNIKIVDKVDMSTASLTLNPPPRPS